MTGMQKMSENGFMDKGTHTNCQRLQAHRRNKVSWALDFGAAIMRPRVPAPVAPIHDSGLRFPEAIQTWPDSFNKA
jgi:hypothetical protein